MQWKFWENFEKSLQSRGCFISSSSKIYHTSVQIQLISKVTPAYQQTFETVTALYLPPSLSPPNRFIIEWHSRIACDSAESYNSSDVHFKTNCFTFVWFNSFPWGINLKEISFAGNHEWFQLERPKNKFIELLRKYVTKFYRSFRNMNNCFRTIAIRKMWYVVPYEIDERSVSPLHHWLGLYLSRRKGITVLTLNFIITILTTKEPTPIYRKLYAKSSFICDSCL